MGSNVLTESLRSISHQYQFQQYLNRRDTDRIHSNAPSRWTRYSTSLMVHLTHAKKTRSARGRGRLSNHLYDWMAHEANIAKGSTPADQDDHTQCPLCGSRATQAHINTTCRHPALIDLRLTHRRVIDQHFQSIYYTALPPAQKWIRLFMDYAEEHLWEDTVLAGDIWNGRWSIHTIEDILLDHSDTVIPPRDYTSAIHWLTHLTFLLQKAQTALYSMRRQIVKYSTIPPIPHTISIRRARTTRHGPRSQTLFTVWNIRYTRGSHPPKRPPRYVLRSDLAPQPSPRRPPPTRIPRSRSSRLTRANIPGHCLGLKHPPARFRRHNTKTPQRETHRTVQLKLRRLG